MPTLSEIRAMGVDNFVNEVVNASYKLNPLEEDGIKSEAEFIKVMKRNDGALSDEWIDTILNGVIKNEKI